MRAFVLICCLATAYSASLGGYDYQRNSAAPSAPIFSSDASLPINNNYDAAPAPAPAPELTKEFFTYSAPEGAFNDNIDNDRVGDSLRRSLRVVFIKGPESSGLENAALQLAKSANEQQTAIYVLNKQADIGDLANKLNSLNHNNANKPEVHFVKYRTQADAENAQHAIQSQYDALGGRSSSTNGGIAPVLDFASKAPVPQAPLRLPEQPNAYLPPNRRF